MTSKFDGSNSEIAAVDSRFKKLEWTPIDRLPKEISSIKTSIENNSTRLIPQLTSSIEQHKNNQASIPIWKEDVREALALRDSARIESASLKRAMVRVKGLLSNEDTLSKRCKQLDEYIYA